ncbi:MAG: hypothetical protein ACLTEX_14110, partial [Eggerthella lenta]
SRRCTPVLSFTCFLPRTPSWQTEEAGNPAGFRAAWNTSARQLHVYLFQMLYFNFLNAHL